MHDTDRSAMAAQNGATVARILDGALRALARRGRHKLSMSDVVELSGISRGTLYRYFRNKEEILDAIAAHIRDGLLKQLSSAVEDRPELDVRVQVVTEALVGFSRTHPEAIQVIALEPEFNVNAVRNLFPEFAILLEELLTPALEPTPAVRSNALTPGELSELILRVAGSTFFIPSENFDEVPLAVAALPCLRVGADGT
ncbi:TetR/AcrR family transcriptional regulator [Rhodococcoides fascians]|jgi:AcrR family transcriptional regulator|uniref:TetR/AcrR family transcriptional regulator n=1 Tax=Rhodococcoides fascians TaxID=1828 RepID=UPI001C91E51C|nr:TetR/AcrR family transcriptional regulator [Rhodococcus fascians]MBY4401068.1 TetR/AcrR family transcriptional regulator [Rhodococcus fascians]MBY4417231.1 TetR/AcrR family transcriptional regulator [Rhodococcus fascians]